MGDVTELGEFLVGEDRRLKLDQVAAGRIRVEQVALRSDGRDGGGDDLFADTVDRRVGHLREELLEVVGQELRPVGEHGQRRVVAHRADRLGAVGGHGREDDFQVFEREAEVSLELDEARVFARHAGGPPRVEGMGMGVNLALEQLFGRLDRAVLGEIADMGRVGKGIQPHLIRRHPLPPWLGGGELPLDLLVFDDPALLGVHEEHPTGPQPALADHLARRQLEHARLARHHHEAVLHLPPAAGPQAVAVERGADPYAVGEGERRRAVPRLHQAGLKLVVGLEVVGHALVAAPRLGDQHAHRLLDRPAGEHQQFEHVVEGGRVAAPLADHRLDLVEVGAKHGMREHALAGVHPVDVAANRVDFAVVGDVAEGVGEVPRREGVGAVALVDERERRRHPRVGKVEVVLAHLIGEQQALVDQRLRREGADVAERLLDEALLPDLDPEPLAGHEQLPLEVVTGHLRATADEGLTDDRFNLAGCAADRAVVGGHVSPAEKLQALLADHLLEELLGGLAVALRRRQKHVADGPVARCRKLDARLRRDGREKLMRNLHENAGAVAGERIAAARTAVGEVFEHLEPLPHDVVALHAVHVDDEAHAAGVVLIGGVVEALLGGKAGERAVGGTCHGDARA